MWLGYDEVVAKTLGSSATGTLDPEELGRRFRTLLDALADTDAGMAVSNLPDPTRIAALRRAEGDVTSCRNPDGKTEPIAADDLLSIDLDPALLPTPPCGKVLDPTERADIRTKVIAFNTEIAAAVQDAQRTRGAAVALVDVFTAFDAAAAAGLDVDKDGAPNLTTGYLGGIFSLDGIHPSRAGNAFIANLFIDAINARFGQEIPRVSVARVAAHDPLVHSPFRPAGEPPFGLIGESEDDDLESLWPETYARIQRDAPGALAALLFAEALAAGLGHLHLPPIHLF